MITIERNLPFTTMSALSDNLKTLTGGVAYGVGSNELGTVVYVTDKITPEIENTIIQTVLTWDATQRTAEETVLETLLGKVKTLQADVGTTKTSINTAADLAALKAAVVTLADQVQTLTRYVKRLGGL